MEALLVALVVVLLVLVLIVVGVVGGLGSQYWYRESHRIVERSVRTAFDAKVAGEAESARFLRETRRYVENRRFPK